MINLTNKAFQNVVFEIESRYHKIDEKMATKPGASTQELWNNASEVYDWCEEMTKGDKIALLECENFAFTSILVNMLVLAGWVVVTPEYDGTNHIGYTIVGIQTGNVLGISVGTFLNFEDFKSF